MEVKIISTENVKPSSPTPPHLRNLTLSFLDQKFGPLLVPTLLFYDAPKGAAAPPPLDITRLKTCLSQTLTAFYPLAGRYQTWGTVLCNDEGIPFVEAEVSCPLSNVVGLISSSSNIELRSFYPPKENLISSGIHLAIQVSKFSCGGFAIGWYHTHKVTDGTSAATFLRHWSSLVTNRYEDAAHALPDFNAPVIAFPPVPEEVKTLTPELNHKEKQEGGETAHVPIPEKEKAKVMTPELNHKEKQEGGERAVVPVPEDVHVQALTQDLNHKEKQEEEKIALPPPILEKELNDKKKQEGEKKEKEGKWNFLFEKRIVVRSFVLKNKAVTELKAKSVSEEVPNPSRFVSVAGFLWKHIASATSKEGRTMLSVGVDLRSRSNPPLPKGAMGNIIEIALARAEKQAQLPELVAEINGSISKIKDLVPEYQGENRLVAKEKYFGNFINSVMEYKGKDIYVVTSWCKSSGFKDMDFGFGKPKWIIPVDDPLNHNQRNAIILTEYTDSEGGDGFEAWLFLEDEPIKFLETCPEFLAFASPNF